MMNKIKIDNKIIKFIISIFLPLFAGTIGSAFTFTGIDSWYSVLNKPGFNPPNWIFGPVWTTLYILMGISLYLIWSKGLKDKYIKKSFKIFIIQLIFNSLWSVVFFGMQSPGLALFIIIVLWSLILTLIIRFYRINKLAAFLLIPYILWVSFASVLNYSIWTLN